MKIKTAELTDAALDWAVARCEVGDDMIDEIDDPHFYSTDWSQGGPIIEREGISIDRITDALWVANRIKGSSVFESDGPTPLIAAMRAFVASQLGDEVDISAELFEER
jgi:hypothetical protein